MVGLVMLPSIKGVVNDAPAEGAVVTLDRLRCGSARAVAAVRVVLDQVPDREGMNGLAHRSVRPLDQRHVRGECHRDRIDRVLQVAPEGTEEDV